MTRAEMIDAAVRRSRWGDVDWAAVVWFASFNEVPGWFQDLVQLQFQLVEAETTATWWPRPKTAGGEPWWARDQ